MHVARLLCDWYRELDLKTKSTRVSEARCSLDRRPETNDASNLLGLLGNALLLSTGVAIDVGQVSSLLDTALEATPGLSDGRRQVLTSGNGVTTSTELVDGRLHKGALVEASSEEDSVDSDQDP